MSILVVEYIDTFILFNASTAQSACSGISFWWGVEVLRPAGATSSTDGSGGGPKTENFNIF